MGISPVSLFVTLVIWLSPSGFSPVSLYVTWVIWLFRLLSGNPLWVSIQCHYSSRWLSGYPLVALVQCHYVLRGLFGSSLCICSSMDSECFEAGLSLIVAKYSFFRICRLVLSISRFDSSAISTILRQQFWLWHISLSLAQSFLTAVTVLFCVSVGHFYLVSRPLTRRVNCIYQRGVRFLLSPPVSLVSMSFPIILLSQYDGWSTHQNS